MNRCHLHLFKYRSSVQVCLGNCASIATSLKHPQTSVRLMRRLVLPSLHTQAYMSVSVADNQHYTEASVSHFEVIFHCQQFVRPTEIPVRDCKMLNLQLVVTHCGNSQAIDLERGMYYKPWVWNANGGCTGTVPRKSELRKTLEQSNLTLMDTYLLKRSVHTRRFRRVQTRIIKAGAYMH